MSCVQTQVLKSNPTIKSIQRAKRRAQQKIKTLSNHCTLNIKHDDLALNFSFVESDTYVH
jgi:hypothetical protein